ncbi:ABC transporter substrate-binding protein [Sulfitobacter sp. F26169L]|uniref:ABC transporter substrate-binding protein n=1 Tax=Sulfitobacter sp. F26169L TaxID=2996015 RepID=UPI0022609F22|nr:ABC transporter substrate-binding protein [Sulfitobacter sp. F26169L]MCX7567419.1 ABC transporter substrate-binding protein [Sulfitobacter sp. F26169L]
MAALCALFGGAPLSADAPSRVVSLNLCTDQLAMLLADEGQLISVSRLAADPRSSAMVEQAAAYPANNGLAEEVYLMQPDLVVAGTYTARATVDMLKRLGIPVALFDPASAMDHVTDRIRQMGDVLGKPARAAAMIADFERQLTAYGSGSASPPRAALYYANGYTLGDKTLAGDILATAGLANIAAEAGFSFGGVIPLEVLTMAQPDTVITSTPYPGASRSEEVTTHPVIQTLRRAHHGATMSDSDWVCGTPFVLRAIDKMVTLRNDVKRGTP